MSNSLLHSNLRPMPKRGPSFVDMFDELCSNSDYMLLTSGYISDESTYFLSDCLGLKGFPSFDLAVGMHAIEGFTRSQYYGLLDLNKKMVEHDKGMAYVSPAFKFHGKAYSFFKDNEAFAAIVGSTNISILGDRNKRQFEMDVLVTDSLILDSVVGTQRDFISFAKSIDDFEPSGFIEAEQKELLKHFVDDDYVEKVGQEYVKIVLDSLDVSRRYDLPLKCEAKSNLNVPFGKPRGGGASGRGRFIARNWLETEVIVGKKITSLSGYPEKISFYVVTDDGWSFECKTQGDYSKNFRSSSSLDVLGAWIKGRLINSGCIRYGDFIEEDDLQRYGRDNITLTATTLERKGLPVFLLDFSVPR